jgi:hypothetical protein
MKIAPVFTASMRVLARAGHDLDQGLRHFLSRIDAPQHYRLSDGDLSFITEFYRGS